jgi:hypothetical protein
VFVCSSFCTESADGLIAGNSGVSPASLPRRIVIGEIRNRIVAPPDSVLPVSAMRQHMIDRFASRRTRTG